MISLKDVVSKHMNIEAEEDGVFALVYSVDSPIRTLACVKLAMKFYGFDPSYMVIEDGKIRRPITILKDIASNI